MHCAGKFVKYTRVRAKLPAWVPCPECGNFLCTYHGGHAHDCDCPALEDWLEDWGTSPYESPHPNSSTAREGKMECLRCQELLGSTWKTGICGTCRAKTLENYRGHKDPEGRTELEMFAEEFQFCWYCGWPGRPVNLCSAWRLHIHHIFGGAYRKHLRTNLARLCNTCHDLAHDGQLTKEHVLWLKREHDPGGYDRAVFRKLLKRPVPCTKKPPEWKPASSPKRSGSS